MLLNNPKGSPLSILACNTFAIFSQHGLFYEDKVNRSIQLTITPNNDFIEYSNYLQQTPSIKTIDLFQHIGLPSHARST